MPPAGIEIISIGILMVSTGISMTLTCILMVFYQWECTRPHSTFSHF